MAKLTKNQKLALSKLEPGKVYTLAEAAAKVKEITFTKFDSSLDIDVRLGVDPRKANQMVRGVVSLPHGTGKQVRVLVLCNPDMEAAAKEAGADYVGLDEYIQKIQGGWTDVDVIITQPAIMGKIGRLGRILGPRGLMPNPKSGTVTQDVAKAVTLNDEEIARLSRESVEWMDANNPVAADSTTYGARLKRLTEGITDADGLPLNFKVYLVTDVNAFACGDGSIRVFAALMDLMDDDELMAIIGHEIGHVVHADTKHAMKNAYLASAARNAAGAAEGSALARLSESQLGKVVATFTDAQFSQKQEYEADEHGFEFCVKHGFDPYGMANSLDKLVELSKGAKASTVQKMFSSHPDSEKRAARMKEKADAYMAAQRQNR